ncbi:hypothetical protein PG997_008780 [Apiospora hydei]|uniref:Uncharacterized protein n=1 Tax=Apiospora hydei TaxID=1337664 RepID=A0ABR1WD75_9PEZI
MSEQLPRQSTFPVEWLSKNTCPDRPMKGLLNRDDQDGGNGNGNGFPRSDLAPRLPGGERNYAASSAIRGCLRCKSGRKGKVVRKPSTGHRGQQIDGRWRDCAASESRADTFLADVGKDVGATNGEVAPSTSGASRQGAESPYHGVLHTNGAGESAAVESQ